MPQVLLIILLCWPSLSLAAVSDTVVKYWDFLVYLNDKPVGRHQFSLSQQGDTVRLQSDMELEFRVLLVKQIRYSHRATEIWHRGCLREVSSNTDRNGEQKTLIAELDEQAPQPGLRLETAKGTEMLQGCVRSFAYWNPDWLQGDSLLNVETGESWPVQITSTQIQEQREVVIAAPKTDIRLRYDADGRWLSLETELTIGGTLRYQRIESINPDASLPLEKT